MKKASNINSSKVCDLPDSDNMKQGNAQGSRMQFKFQNINTSIYPLTSLKVYSTEAVIKTSNIVSLYSQGLQSSYLCTDRAPTTPNFDKRRAASTNKCDDSKTLLQSKIIGLKEQDILPVVSGIADVDLSVSASMTCATCKVTFVDRDMQKEHYKLDWHRLNLRLKSSGLQIISEEKFEQMASEGNVSSISGSDTDTEEEDIPQLPITLEESTYNNSDMDNLCVAAVGRKSCEVYFHTTNGELLSIYRCILQSIRGATSDDELILSLKTVVSTTPTNWAIIMLAGGHFAAAIYNGPTRLLHKTFHRYIIRAKRGTAQSVCDNRKGRSNAAKSSGAGLRRYNQAALTQEIQDLIISWSSEIMKCSHIFVRAASFNRNMLFPKVSAGSSSSPVKGLSKNDARVRTIPFATRRPTLHEVSRVHELLSTLYIYSADEVESYIMKIMDGSSKEGGKIGKDVKEPVQDCAEFKNGPNSYGKDTASAAVDNNSECVKDVEAEQEEYLEHLYMEDVQIEMGDSLKEFEANFTRPKRKKQSAKRMAKEMKPSWLKGDVISTLTCLCSNETCNNFKDELFGLYKTYINLHSDVARDEIEEKSEEREKCKLNKEFKQKYDKTTAGDIDQQEAVFDDKQGVDPVSCEEDTVVQNMEDSNIGGDVTAVEQPTALSPRFGKFPQLLNQWVNVVMDEGKHISESGGLLHLAAAKGQHLICSLLLEFGFDPTHRSTPGGYVPYVMCADSGTKDVFKEYRTSYPLSWNYNKACIPEPVSEELMVARAEKQAGKRRAKKQKQKTKKVERAAQEAEENERQRYLSLSDREKRALAAERRLKGQDPGVVVSRCFQCGRDMTGKVPFEYLNYRFCAMPCLKQHKQQSSTSAGV